MKQELVFKASHRDVVESDESYALHEPTEAYAGSITVQNEIVRQENTLLWNDENLDDWGR